MPKQKVNIQNIHVNVVDFRLYGDVLRVVSDLNLRQKISDSCCNYRPPFRFDSFTTGLGPFLFIYLGVLTVSFAGQLRLTVVD